MDDPLTIVGQIVFVVAIVAIVSRFMPQSRQQGNLLGLRRWFAKKISKPSRFADPYTSGLTELIEHLAGALVICSGTRTVISKTTSEAALFETIFDLEAAGFEATDPDITQLLAPNIEHLR